VSCGGGRCSSSRASCLTGETPPALSDELLATVAADATNGRRIELGRANVPAGTGHAYGQLCEELIDGQLGEGPGHDVLKETLDLKFDLGSDLSDNVLAAVVEQRVGRVGQGGILAAKQVVQVDLQSADLEVNVGVAHRQPPVVGRADGDDAAEPGADGVGQVGVERTLAVQGDDQSLALSLVVANHPDAWHSDSKTQCSLNSVSKDLFGDEVSQTLDPDVGQIGLNVDCLSGDKVWFGSEGDVFDEERIHGIDSKFGESNWHQSAQVFHRVPQALVEAPIGIVLPRAFH